MAELTQEQQDFLAECEEELKDRFTDNDEEFMSVLNAEPSDPPIVEPWHAFIPNDRRNNRAHERRHHRRDHPYQRDGRDYRDNRHDGRDYRDNRHDGNYRRRDARERRPY